MKKLRKGTKCRFTPSSGNPPRIVTVAGNEMHNGLVFYRLEGIVGGLFLSSSIEKL